MTLDNLLALLAIAFASNGIVDVWLAGRIFDKPRAYAEALEGFFGKLLTCGYCLSFWVVPAIFTLWAVGLEVVVYYLATLRFATLLWSFAETPLEEDLFVGTNTEEGDERTAEEEVH